MRLITDYHCHLYEPVFDPDRDDVIARAKKNGITRFCCDASKESDWERIENLYRQYGEQTIRPGFGIHPWFANATAPGWQDRLTEKLRQYPSAVVAEIGIDWIRRAEVPFDVQTAVFLEQMSIARNYGRSVTVHCLRAWDKMPALLNEFGAFIPEITFHSFSGATNDIDWLLARYNAFFSYGVQVLAGVKSKQQKTLQYLRSIAPDRIRYESDSPYMPLRPGERNEPAFIVTENSWE